MIWPSRSTVAVTLRIIPDSRNSSKILFSKLLHGQTIAGGARLTYRLCIKRELKKSGADTAILEEAVDRTKWKGCVKAILENEGRHVVFDDDAIY
jgi:hypothetical protein